MPKLDPHLHTELCNIYVRHYKKCLEENSLFSQMLGSCSDLHTEMVNCLNEERTERKRAAYAKSPARQHRKRLEMEKTESKQTESKV